MTDAVVVVAWLAILLVPVALMLCLVAIQHWRDAPEEVMGDDPTKRAADAKRIALGQDHEMRYWTRRLDCTEDELREAVAAVGHMVTDVEAWLERRRAKA
jgi:hypothetical protein